MSRTVLVCGSRNWTRTAPVRRELIRLRDRYGSLWVVQGRARGADEIAYRVTKELGMVPWSFPVTDEDWKSKGRSAGVQRNQVMLEKTQPDEVLAFTADLSSSRETADMVRRAEAAGLLVRVFQR